MNTQYILTIIGCSVFLNAPALAGDDAAASPVPVGAQEFAPVMVQGMGNPAVTSYANLLRGVQAFHDNHSLAPTATLRFRAIDLSPADGPLKLRLETEDKVIPIEVDRDGFFVLPESTAVGAADGELVANRRAGSARIGPVIRSAGFDDMRFRLGDERLWCEVASAIGKDEISLPLRLLVALRGPICKNPRVKVAQFFLRETVLSGKLSEGNRQVELEVNSASNKVYFPLNDATWTNDGIVQLQMADTKAKPAQVSR